MWAARTSPPPAARRPAAATCAPPPGSWSGRRPAAGGPPRPPGASWPIFTTPCSSPVRRAVRGAGRRAPRLARPGRRESADRARPPPAGDAALPDRPGATPIDTLRKEVERSIARLEEAGDEGNLAQALAISPRSIGSRGTRRRCWMPRSAPWPRAHVRQPLRDRAAPLIAYALHHGRSRWTRAWRVSRGRARAPRRPAGAGPDATRRGEDAGGGRPLRGRARDRGARARSSPTSGSDGGWRCHARSRPRSPGARAITSRRRGSSGRCTRSSIRGTRTTRSIEAALADLLCDMGRFLEADALASEVARDAPTDDLEVQVERRPSLTAAAGTLHRRVVGGRGCLARRHDGLPPAPGGCAARARRRAPAAGRDAEAIVALEHAADRYDAKRATEPASETRRRVRHHPG